MNSLKKDLLTGLLVITGIGCFIYGQFVMSTLSLAVATIYSHIAMRIRSNR